MGAKLGAGKNTFGKNFFLSFVVFHAMTSQSLFLFFSVMNYSVFISGFL